VIVLPGGFFLQFLLLSFTHNILKSLKFSKCLDKSTHTLPESCFFLQLLFVTVHRFIPSSNSSLCSPQVLVRFWEPPHVIACDEVTMLGATASPRKQTLSALLGAIPWGQRVGGGSPWLSGEADDQWSSYRFPPGDGVLYPIVVAGNRLLFDSPTPQIESL